MALVDSACCILKQEILYNVCMQENYNIGNIAVVLYTLPIISTDFDFTTDRATYT